MNEPQTIDYRVDARVARITLNRPQRGNGLTLQLIRELTECVERADLDPEVHVVLLADNAKIGYSPARVWGSPTTSMWAYRLGAQRAKRLLFTGDSLSGREAVEWGLAIEAPAADQLDERTEILVERIARMPINQLMM